MTRKEEDVSVSQGALRVEVFEPLQGTLGHEFGDLALLRQALTHSSARKKRSTSTSSASVKSYERLEFLGDRVLGLTIARMLYETFPGEPEGHLAKRLSLLVSRATLALVARELELQQYIMVSDVERLSGGLENDGLLSDVVESLIAALYLDADLDTAEAFIKQHWASRLTQNKNPPRDPKSMLQEWSQGRIRLLPEYRLIDCTGPSHKPCFSVSVSVEGFGEALGHGSSKRKAESDAAESLIKALKSDGTFMQKEGKP